MGRTSTYPESSSIAIPTEGANFLLHLEQVVGGLDVFLPYVSAYVRTFKGKALDTTIWKADLENYFAKNDPEAASKLKSVDWEVSWLPFSTLFRSSSAFLEQALGICFWYPDFGFF